MNFSFYVSGNAGTLKKVIESNSISLQQTKLVISSNPIKDSSLKHELKNRNIEYLTYEHDGLFSDFVLNSFLKNKIDYCFCFGHHILKGKIIEVYKNKIINFHPSILPLYPGVKAIDQSILDDKSILIGNTAHFIDKGIDTGPIIMQSIAPKTLFKTQGYDGVLNLQLPMLEFIYKKLIDNKITVKKQKVIINNIACTPKFFYNNE